MSTNTEFNLEFIPRTCQWIYGIEDKCRMPTDYNKPYCEVHMRQAYQDPNAPVEQEDSKV